jgi:hypothetical protein
MLFSTSTDIYTGIGQVTTGIFSDIQGYVIAIIGIVLGLFVLSLILQKLYPDRHKPELDNYNE